MAMIKDSQNIIVGLDVGTSKVMAIVAQVDDHKNLAVLGYGMQASHGLKKGAVVNIEMTINSIQTAIQEAEVMAERPIKEVYIGISGSHIQSKNTDATVAIKERKEVTQWDIDRALEVARTVTIANDHVILHCVPQTYSVDDQEDIREPLGMSGMRLGVKAHVITSNVSAIENLEKCVRRSGVEVRACFLQPLVAAEAVLNEDEKDIGVCLVDIGGGTTDVAIFTGGAIRHTAIIPIAGDQITNDIVMLLRTPTKEAEDIKVLHGCALRQFADQNDFVEVPSVSGRDSRKISRHMLANVIEARVEEIYKMVLNELKSSGYMDLVSSGIVLTGGTAQLAGIVELGEEILHLPVRVGVPRYEGTLSEIVNTPRFAVGMGLLFKGKEQWLKTQAERHRKSGVLSALHGMKQWFKTNF